jgi:hypothetical protein
MFEFGASVRRGIASPACKHAVVSAALAVVLVFVSVNQVLVRLWARVSRDRSSDWSTLPSFGRMSDRELPFARAAPQRSAARVQRRCERFCRIRTVCDCASNRSPEWAEKIL